MTNSIRMTTRWTRIGTLLIIVGLFISFAGSLADATQRTPRIQKRVFGKLADGGTVDLYTLTNKNGLQAQISTYGGVLVTLRTPDQRGRMADIVLGYDNARGYVNDASYFGALIGRFANRIAGGKFTLEGQEYQLAQNNDANHLHGGVRGFDKAIWQAKPIDHPDGVALELTYLSKDGEENYPGNLSVTVVYSLTNADELRLDYEASTDKPTIINLTHHSYFNLSGQGTGSILSHEVRINADRFTPVDKDLIPTGQLQSVTGTPFDFTQMTPIGKRIYERHPQLLLGRGYDHNYVLNNQGKELSLAAEVFDPKSGRGLEMWTTEPGMQFYTGNFLNGARGKAGRLYNFRDGFCLEAQHFPDSPNQPAFPSTVLKPNEKYTQTTVYKFIVKGS